jgi:hypothetical protein
MGTTEASAVIMPLETLLQILIYAKPGVIGPPLLTSMQGGYEDDFVVILQDVFTFPLQLPISVIYQDEDTRSPGGSIRYIVGK